MCWCSPDIPSVCCGRAACFPPPTECHWCDHVRAGRRADCPRHGFAARTAVAPTPAAVPAREQRLEDALRTIVRGWDTDNATELADGFLAARALLAEPPQ